MAAKLEQLAEDRLRDVIAFRRTLEGAEQAAADAYLRYIRDARKAGWSWRRIARGLDMTDTGVRRYWEAHKQRVGRLRG